MTLWKIYCMEDSYPGIWRHWYRHQCVAVGWPPADGYRYEGPTPGDEGWLAARSALRKIEVGDTVVVSLQGNRVGRLGEVTGLCLEDSAWDPLVPKRPNLPSGQMGRRIKVRWDLASGPEDRDSVVLLPPKAQFKGAELRRTIARVGSRSVDDLRETMNDRANWVGLLAFKYERALSDYIAAYPHRLEDGLVPHPDAKVRERVFKDRTRLDVLLLDRDERPVIVECKQNAPTVSDLEQLRRYLSLLQTETGKNDVRGLLVHLGTRRPRPEVVQAARTTPRLELLFYSLYLEFDRSDAD